MVEKFWRFANNIGKFYPEKLKVVGVIKLEILVTKNGSFQHGITSFSGHTAQQMLLHLYYIDVIANDGGYPTCSSGVHYVQLGYNMNMNSELLRNDR